MNRLVWILVAGAASWPLLVDASIKAATLLLLAGGCVLLMRRASAAARHMAWLAAVTALLLVPLFSMALPGWRVLPRWAAVEARSESPAPPHTPYESPASHGIVSPAEQASPAAEPLPAGSALVPPLVGTAKSPELPQQAAGPLPVPPSPGFNFTAWLAPAWAVGCGALLLRLLAAHVLLRRITRCSALAGGSLTESFAAIQQETGMRRPVRLLVDETRTIPLVWGIVRPTLMLPAEAMTWDPAQLRSVLLHELAHLRRRDPLAQFLAQIACALHWFNPLVWLAAWRLHVERERACDDLVLASGVKPSTYAEHILHIATKLSSARWTHACGLAMARKSGLESRLLAVLSHTLNRRRLTRALTAAAILLSAAVAVPIAMLRASEKEPSANDSTTASPMKIDSSTEAQLDWGEPVNGLRGTLLIRPVYPGAEEGIFLAVQNVSDKPLHFADTTEAKDLRKLYLSDQKGILMALTSSQPTKADATLQTREVAYLRLLDPVASGQKSLEPNLIEGIRKDSLQTWRAVLEIQSAPDGAWKGKLTSGETRCPIRPDPPQPKDAKARALFKAWQPYARLNGDIPGGLVRLLHGKVKEFIRNNEPDVGGAPYAVKMKPLEPRFGELRDWKPAEIVALMDDIAAAHTIPLEVALTYLNEHTLYPGQPLPAAYAKADWGEPLESGLRMAYLLEPQAAQYHLGTEVKSHMILHNSGKEPAAFVTHSFQQPGHSAKLAGGGELKLDSTYWTTLGSPMAYRLAPGEYCEIHTPGLGIGAQNKDRDDWASVRAGSWILCREGDEVIFSPGPALLSRKCEQPDTADWWLEFITQRLERETPLPLDTKEREYLLYRVVRELYGAAPSTTEGDAFNADKSPDALKNLAALLAKHPYGKQIHGSITAGDTIFKVLPPDAEAGKRVRVASGPGYYNLTDNLKFSVTRLPLRTGTTISGNLIYFQQGKDNAITKVELPDGYNTWAAAMEPGTTVLWIKQNDLTRRYDFTDPANIKETRHEGEVPARVLEAIKPILATPLEAPAPKDNPPPAAAPDEKKTSAAEPSPDSVELEKGRAAIKAGDRAAGREHYLKAVQLNPNRGEAHFNLSVLYATDDPPDFAKAKEHYQQGIKLGAKPDEGMDKLVGIVRPGTTPVVQSAFTADPDAAKKPRMINGPGRVVLNKHVHLQVSRTSGDTPTITNTGEIIFLASDPEKESPHKPYKVALPEGMNTYAIVWERGSGSLMVVERGSVRTINFADPANVTEERAKVNLAPKYRQLLPPGLLHEQNAAPATEKPKTSAVKLTPESLLGHWRGTVNEEKLMLSFHRPPAEKDVQCDIYFGEATIGEPASFTISEDGGSVEVVQHSAGGGMKFGTLTPVGEGKLKLELYGRQQGQQELMLTRDAEAAATEPRQKEARELFDMWKRTANADATIPGTFIGQLATEVRAYVKANPNLDSAAKLPKLLPRFVTSRDWTQAEAIALLDDVAYYAVAPIEAYVAKAKLPSGPLWRTMLEFQDISVKIEKWSEAKDGLRIGLRVVGGEWSAGGKVSAELWLHNAGGKDVSFQTAGPNRQDYEVIFTAIDAEGKEHWPEINPTMLMAMPLDCSLPAGHVAMVKEFDVTFADADNNVWTALGHRFRDLKPGKYQLRCSWQPAWPGPVPIELTAPDFAFTFGGVAAADAPAPKTAANPPASASEYVTVTLAKDDGISYEREAMTLEQLRTAAIKDAKKWFTIRAKSDVPYAKVVEVMDALRKAGVVRISLNEGQAGDGKFRVASGTGNYPIDDQRSFSICKLSSRHGYFTVHWRAKKGDPVSEWVRIQPEEPDGVRGTWAVAWEPGTDVLWWIDDADIGRMTLTNPKQVIVERSARVGARPPGFVPPDGVQELFESLGFHKGLWNGGTTGGDGNLWKRVMEATPVKAQGDGKAQQTTASWRVLRNCRGTDAGSRSTKFAFETMLSQIERQTLSLK